jgi:aspartyl-tRNA(Asn)/glutamyl-tRNA(Gln) amidotransferase subunit B
MLDLTYETPKPKIMSGAKQDWELVIGMEVHAQVSSKAKLFSGASTASGPSPIPTSPSSTRACPACCPSSTNSAWRRPCAPGWA